MTTILRHVVPADSYNPNRPFNDLGREQLQHFIHAEERLPQEKRTGLAVPSPEDGPAASRYIAAVTAKLLEHKGKPKLKVMQRPRRRAPVQILPAIAAEAKPAKSRAKTAEKKAGKTAKKTAGKAAKRGAVVARGIKP